MKTLEQHFISFGESFGQYIGIDGCFAVSSVAETCDGFKAFFGEKAWIIAK